MTITCQAVQASRIKAWWDSRHVRRAASRLVDDWWENKVHTNYQQGVKYTWTGREVANSPYMTSGSLGTPRICTLQETNISHLGKRNIIFKYALSGGYVNSLEGTRIEYIHNDICISVLCCFCLGPSQISTTCLIHLDPNAALGPWLFGF